VIAETKHAESFGSENSIASSVACFTCIVEMLTAIDFDDQLHRVRNEIHNVRPDWRLTTKAGALKPMCPQAVPDRALGLGHVSSEGSRTRPRLGAHLPNRKA
jgi:hypothetical protein